MFYKDYVNSILQGHGYSAPDTGADGSGAGGSQGNDNDGKPKGPDAGDGGGKKGEDKPAGKTYTEEQLQAAIQDRLARERKRAQDEKDEAEKMAKMSDDDKVKHQMEQLQKELEDQKAQNARFQMTAEARKQLAEADIEASDEDLALIVTAEAETTTTNVKQLIDFAKRISEAERKKYTAGRTPGASVGGQLDPGAAAAKARNEATNVVKDPWAATRA